MSEVLLRSWKIAPGISPLLARPVIHCEKEITFVSCCLFLASQWWVLLICLLFRCLKIFYLVVHFFLEFEVRQVVHNFWAPFLLKIESMVVERQFCGSSFILPKFSMITANSHKISSVSFLRTLRGNSSVWLMIENLSFMFLLFRRRRSCFCSWN